MRNFFKGGAAVFGRELAGYFATPVAYVFMVIFLVLTGIFAWSQGLGSMYERGQADLRPFFGFHPWLYLFLIPAVAMRLWAEERKQGTIELLLTLPVSLPGAVVGKFLAAWAFVAAALVGTVPVWITVNYLGSPDNGAILTAYIGSLLMAGGFLAIGACVSAATKSQVIAFIVALVVCFVFLMAGYPPVQDMLSGWAPRPVVEAIAGFSFLTRFENMSKGVIDSRDVLFFATLIAACLGLNTLILERGKGS